MEHLKIITANTAKWTTGVQENNIKNMESEVNELLSQGYTFRFASDTGNLLCVFLVKDDSNT
jgi:hypothetical protein